MIATDLSLQVKQVSHQSKSQLTLGFKAFVFLHLIDVAVPDVDLQWAPFHTILMKSLSDSSSDDGALDQADREFKVVPRHSPAVIS